jgi:hypothetical protein
MCTYKRSSRIGTHSHIDRALVLPDVKNSTGHGLGDVGIGKVAHEHFDLPAAATIPHMIRPSLSLQMPVIDLKFTLQNFDLCFKPLILIHLVL